MNERNRVFTLSRSEMLELWRLVRHLEPLRTDATVTRSDGLNLSALVENSVDRWYERLLLESPEEDIPLVNLSADSRVTTAPDGVVKVELPERCLRVFSATLQGWTRPAVITDDPLSDLALLQDCEELRGGSVAPVGVLHPGGVLMLYSVEPGSAGVLTDLKCAALPASDNEFPLTRSMLPASLHPYI